MSMYYLVWNPPKNENLADCSQRARANANTQVKKLKSKKLFHFKTATNKYDHNLIPVIEAEEEAFGGNPHYLTKQTYRYGYNFEKFAVE